MGSEVTILSLPLTRFVNLGKSLNFFELLMGNANAIMGVKCVIVSAQHVGLNIIITVLFS